MKPSRHLFTLTLVFVNIAFIGTLVWWGLATLQNFQLMNKNAQATPPAHEKLNMQGYEEIINKAKQP